jgi:hypothetical protein
VTGEGDITARTDHPQPRVRDDADPLILAERVLMSLTSVSLLSSPKNVGGRAPQIPHFSDFFELKRCQYVGPPMQGHSRAHL